MGTPAITLSVVSHKHGPLVLALLRDIRENIDGKVAVILTLNVPEDLPFDPEKYGLRLSVVRNPAPRGFAANHNAAFRQSSSPWFCVVNPDIRLSSDPFDVLLPGLAAHEVGVIAPMVRNPAGEIEDSARRYPTPASLLAKLFGKLFGLRQTPDYDSVSGPFEPEWVAGMFMLFRRETYAELGGFDERYFLYYEDVDLCARMRLRGKKVVCDPRACVVHEARRASHRNPYHAWWHLRSLIRFLMTPGYLRLRGHAVH